MKPLFIVGLIVGLVSIPAAKKAFHFGKRAATVIKLHRS